MRTRQQSWLVALAMLVLASSLAALTVLAVRQIRATSAVLIGHEAETMLEAARFAARVLHQQAAQADGRALRGLDLQSLPALVESLRRVASNAADVTGFALLEDGTRLYPPPADPAWTTGGGAGLDVVWDSRADLFRQLRPDEVLQVCRPAAGGPLVASVHRMQVTRGIGLIGFRWGPHILRQWLRETEAEAVPTAYRMSVEDARGARVGPASGAGPVAAGVTAALPASGFAWHVRISPRDPDRARALVRRQALFYVGVLGLLFLLIAVGAWMLAAIALREMRLARLRSEAAANISHELRTPLALIRGAAESLTMGRDLAPDRQVRYLELIRKESERLSDLVSTVLRFSRLERGLETAALDVVDVGAAVGAFVAEYGHPARARGFRLDCRVPPAPVYARLDPTAMHVILGNLLDNAIKFSPENGAATVTVEADAATVRVAVADRGAGLPDEEHDRVFDIFARGAGDAVKRTRGAGVGLALVRQLARAHGGRVTVRSAPGQGATFTVHLPRCEGTSATA